MTAIPRPASTVVLMDELSRVYLTKRPETMKFYGGYYVFPGGAVEEDDYALDSEFIKSWQRNESFDPAHYIAAARELFEEVGVLLANTDDESHVQFTKESEMEYRRLLIKGEISLLEMLKQEGLYLNLKNLTYFGHLTTPKERPVRFSTRFFLAQLPKGQFPTPDLNEIDEAIWLAPADALEANQTGKISLGPPTIHALKTILNYQTGSPLMMPELRK